MGTFTDSEKASCAAREAEMRRRVYSRKGELTSNLRREIAMMDEIAEDYRQRASNEVPTIFGEDCHDDDHRTKANRAQDHP